MFGFNTMEMIVVGVMFGTTEMIVVGVIAVLLFGKRLPEVARSLGKSFVEFKKGIHGVESEINDAIYREEPRISNDGSVDTEDEPNDPIAPKFEPPEREPQDSSTPQPEASSRPPSTPQPEATGSESG